MNTDELFREFSDALLKGDFDDILDDVQEAVRLRKNIRTQIKSFGFQVGDRVRFTNSTNPAYLRGVEGTIAAKRTKKFVLNLDNPVGRFSGRGIIVPPSIIEKVG